MKSWQKWKRELFIDTVICANAGLALGVVIRPFVRGQEDGYRGLAALAILNVLGVSLLFYIRKDFIDME